MRAQHPDIEAPNVVARLRVEPGQDARRYNLPTANEIAVIVGNSTEPDPNRDIILALRTPNNQLRRIYDTHPAYQTLAYVSLFPQGEHG